MLNYEANIRKMYLFQLLVSLYFVGAIMVPFYMFWGKIGYMQIMILQAIFIFSVFIFEMPTGAVADQFGRKTSILSGAICGTVSILIYSSIPSIFIFIIAEIIGALGISLVSGADEAIIYDTMKKLKKVSQFKRVIGRYASFLPIGLFIAGPIGSIVAAKIGLRQAMMITAIPFFFSIFVALTIKEPPVKKKIKKVKYSETLVKGILYFRKHGILKILSFDMVLISVFSFMMVWTYQPFLLERGLGLMYLGFVMALMTVGSVIVMNNFEKLEKVFKSKLNYLRISAIITSVSFILIGFVELIPLIVVLFIMIESFGITREVLFKNYMNQHIESEVRATIMSCVYMLQSLIQGIFYIVLGFLVTWSLKYTHIILGILILVTIIISKIEEEHLLF